MVWVILQGTRYNADKILSYGGCSCDGDYSLQSYGIRLKFEDNSESVEIYYGPIKSERDEDLKKLDDIFGVYESSENNSY